MRTPVPRVVGQIRRKGPVEVRDMQFLRANTDRTAKITLPGPFTMSQQAINEYYKDADEMVMDYAVAVNAEARTWSRPAPTSSSSTSPGCATTRPPPSASPSRPSTGRCRASACRPSCICASATRRWCPARPSRWATPSCRELADSTAEQISIEAAQPKLDLGVLKDLAPKKILLGVLDLGDTKVETPRKVADRIRARPQARAGRRLIPAPDCGMKYLPREVAFGKLKALAEGAAIVRAELS